MSQQFKTASEVRNYLKRAFKGRFRVQGVYGTQGSLDGKTLAEVERFFVVQLLEGDFDVARRMLNGSNAYLEARSNH